MGANITVTPAGEAAGEPVADFGLRFGALNAIDLEAEIAPSLIDEYPVLAVACAFAEGTSRWLRGLAELRAEESDRLAATRALLISNGVDARIEDDDRDQEGGQRAGGGMVRSLGDHRIAMSGLVLGLAARDGVQRGRYQYDCDQLSRLHCRYDSAGCHDRGASMIIAVDGTLASGKGTVARGIAQVFGLAHLDTGALYRAVAVVILKAGGDPSDADAAAQRRTVTGPLRH